MPTLAMLPAASSVNTSPAAPQEPVDATRIDVTLAAAQTVAPPQAEAGETAVGATPETATPDVEAAATLAGAMLAMLERVTGNTPAASPAADATAIAADGSASGHAKAAMLRQAVDEQTLATADAPVASPIGMPDSMENLLAPIHADVRKDRGLDALALATAPASAATPVAVAVVLPRLQLAASPGSPGFADELGQQVLWLGRQDIREARIRLHPEDLGSLDVHLSVNHERVDVVFSAQHPAAVTAVQQSLPQLDQLLARHGLALGHAEVGQQNRGDERARDQGRGAAAATGEIEAVHTADRTVAMGRVGLLDAFA